MAVIVVALMTGSLSSATSLNKRLVNCGEYEIVNAEGDCGKSPIPIVRGEKASIALFPRGKTYPRDFPGFSGSATIVSPELTDTQEVAISRGVIARDLSEKPFEGINGFKELATGHYIFGGSESRTSSNFFVPLEGELEETERDINLLKLEIADRKRLKLSLAFLFLKNGFNSNAISLLWDKRDDDQLGLVEDKLILGAALKNALPASAQKRQLIRGLAEKVLLADGVSKEQKKEAIALINLND